MKRIIAVSLLIMAAGTAYALSVSQQSNLREQQLANYKAQLSQLLSQLESNSLQRLDYEKQIQQLSSQLTTSNSQVTALSNQLSASQNQINPDYQQVEADIRRQLNTEMQQRQSVNSSSDSRSQLVRQLTELAPVELGELMALQGQFGGFLQSLDVDDQRMDVIVDALSNLIGEQNQARRELAMEIQSLPQDSSRREIRAQMRDISNPAAQRESLSYALSEVELDALEEFQSQQPAPAMRTFIGSPRGAGRAGAFSGGDISVETTGGSVINRVFLSTEPPPPN